LIQLPPLYIEKMQRLLGDEAAAFLAIYAHSPQIALRINTLKIPVSEFQRISPFGLKPIPWCPDGFWLEPAPDQPGRHPFHAAGLYYMQDASALAVAQALQPEPGQRVLDLAAAPGGKCTHILNLLGKGGLLVANEIHPKRAWELAENLERWGARNAIITNETPERLADTFGSFFHRILLDAPCSGEGMFRKSEAARRDWSPALVQACAMRQESILTQAARMLVPGGRLVYSTCTFSPEENEQTVARFLSTHPEFSLEAVPGGRFYASGHAEWVDPPASRAPGIDLTARLWPHLGMGEGHFIAVMQRQPGGGGSQLAESHPPPLPETALRLYREFCELFANGELEQPGKLVLQGEQLYRLPPHTPRMHTLRLLRQGLWLGTYKTNRFEPSHSLALALSPHEAANTADLSVQQAERYLHGEVLEYSGPPGWVLLTLQGFPLGWGKRVGDVIKNAYPKGLRWM
jgi:NOL1/NOP2/sun family putative RNA methylase